MKIEYDLISEVSVTVHVSAKFLFCMLSFFDNIRKKLKERRLIVCLTDNRRYKKHLQ